MLVRRMSQRNRSEQEKKIREATQKAKEVPATPSTATATLERELAEKDTAMLDLQRRVEGRFQSKQRHKRRRFLSWFCTLYIQQYSSRRSFLSGVGVQLPVRYMIS